MAYQDDNAQDFYQWAKPGQYNPADQSRLGAVNQAAEKLRSGDKDTIASLGRAYADRAAAMEMQKARGALGWNPAAFAGVTAGAQAGANQGALPYVAKSAELDAQKQEAALSAQENTAKMAQEGKLASYELAKPQYDPNAFARWQANQDPNWKQLITSGLIGGGMGLVGTLGGAWAKKLLGPAYPDVNPNPNKAPYAPEGVQG